MFLFFLAMAIFSYIVMIILTGIMTNMSKLEHEWYMLPISLFWFITWPIRYLIHIKYKWNNMSLAPNESFRNSSSKLGG